MTVETVWLRRLYALFFVEPGSRCVHLAGCTASGAPSGEPEASRDVRWSGRHKERVVLRLLRGESLDLLARETGQPAGRIAGWREEFLQAGREGLKSRPAPEGDRRLLAAQRKVGELQLEVDILRALLEKKGSPPSPRRSR